MFSSEKRFEFKTEQDAAAACRAVSVELKNTFEKRSTSSIQTNKNVVLLKVLAEDELALGASVGFYSRLLMLCNELVLEEF